jgi:hypothetical protein
MKEIILSPQEYTSCFLELAQQANEKFQLVKSNSKTVIVLVTVAFAMKYGF